MGCRHPGLDVYSVRSPEMKRKEEVLSRLWASSTTALVGSREAIVSPNLCISCSSEKGPVW